MTMQVMVAAITINIWTPAVQEGSPSAGRLVLEVRDLHSRGGVRFHALAPGAEREPHLQLQLGTDHAESDRLMRFDFLGPASLHWQIGTARCFARMSLTASTTRKTSESVILL